MIGRLAAGAVTAGLMLVGLGALFAPKPSSGQYGLSVDDDAALGYVRALGVRDLVFGLIMLRFLAANDDEAVATTLGIGTLIAVGDFGVVLAVRGMGPHLLVHAIGGVGMAGAYALALREAGGDADAEAAP